MSRSTTFIIDGERFKAAIDEIVKTRHFTSWSAVCDDMMVNKDLLAQALRDEKISSRTAKLLERFYGLTPDQYTPVIEGIFEEPQEEKNVIAEALEDPKVRETLRGIIASAIVAAMKAQGAE